MMLMGLRRELLLLLLQQQLLLVQEHLLLLLLLLDQQLLLLLLPLLQCRQLLLMLNLLLLDHLVDAPAEGLHALQAPAHLKELEVGAGVGALELLASLAIVAGVVGPLVH
jgi:hypothetical protein